MLNTLTLIVLILFSINVQARTANGTLVFKKGEVKVLGKKVEKARVGMHVKSGQTIVTGKNGRAKIIYDNGEVIFVGHDSEMKMPKSTNSKKHDDHSLLELSYGKVRAIVSQHVSKDEQFIIKTHTAVTGVRGTDVHVDYHKDKGTHVSVLSGKVEVHVGEDKHHVHSGKKAIVHKKVEHEHLDHEDLHQIHSHTSKGVEVPKYLDHLHEKAKKLILTHFDDHKLDSKDKAQDIHHHYLKSMKKNLKSKKYSK